MPHSKTLFNYKNHTYLYKSNGNTSFSRNPETSSNTNTSVIIVALALTAVIVLVTGILGYCFYRFRRKSKKKRTQDIPSKNNSAYEADTEADTEAYTEADEESDIGDYTEPYTSSSQQVYASDGVYADLDDSKREPRDTNYQSLVHEDHQRPLTNQYEDVHLYATVNKERKPKRGDNFSEGESDSSINV